MFNGALKEREILVARIDMLTHNLRRIRDLLDNKDKLSEADKIRGKFASKINPLSRELETLRKEVMAGDPGTDVFSNAWARLEGLSQTARQINSQCLDFLGGLAARRWELEGGFCNLSEFLVGEIANKTGVSWGSVMILGEERPIDDIAATTQIIRIRFPEWDIWSLPFIACEYGQIVARSDDIEEFKNLFKDEESRINDFIEKESITDSSQWAEDLIEARKKYQTAREANIADPQGNKSLLMQAEREKNAFVKKLMTHLRILFSDILATFFMGPAYLYARTYLRLIPVQLADEEQNLPSLERRSAIIFETLKKMNEAEKPEALASGVYDAEISSFEELWKKTVNSGLPNFGANKLAYKDPCDSWFDVCFNTLSSVCYHEGFEGSHWKLAEALAIRLEGSIPNPPEFTKSDTLPVILNAAWICRKTMPDRVPQISDAAYKLCLNVTQAKVSTQEERRR